MFAKYGAPAVVAGWRLVQGPAVGRAVAISEKAKRMLADPRVPDAEVEAQLALELGSGVRVATYTGDFETRRVQMQFLIASVDALDEDIRVITFHHVKLVGGLPSSDWTNADYNAIFNAYGVFWENMKRWYTNVTIWDGVKIYKAGPNISPPQAPVFEVVDLNIAGLSTGMMLPPQASITVTEKVGQHKNWGRFYLPAPAFQDTAVPPSMASSPAGRISADLQGQVIANADTLYTGCAGVLLPHVVYRPLLAANRPTGNPPQPSELPERPANAETVNQLQVDDVWDVIRSRRYENPKTRLQAAVGGAGTTGEAQPLPAPAPVGDGASEAPKPTGTPVSTLSSGAGYPRGAHAP